MAKEWKSENNLICRNGIPMASAYGLATAEFLAAAAEYYTEFLRGTAHIPDADIEPEQLAFAFPSVRSQCVWPNCICDEDKCWYETQER